MKAYLTALFMGAMCISLHGQEQRFKGYPSPTGEIDIEAHFARPPKGYGNVPFFWWNGDSLRIDRLRDELDLLSDAAVDGFAVSYIHSHPGVDRSLNAGGYGGYGKPDPGSPAVFSDKWWELWNQFSGECADRGLGVGLDDYVLGWSGNGYYPDEVLRDPSIAAYQGRLRCTTYEVEPGAVLEVDLEKAPLSLMAYPQGLDLSGHVQGLHLSWASPFPDKQTVYVVYTEPSCELHPDYGRKLVDVYFDRFADRLDERGRRGMNYFFQDELHYNLTLHSWAEDMPAEFVRRKGYDIVPYLPVLFGDIGPVTPKIRLDYAEVLTELSEERYFIPVFNWHNERGLIYGCDNNGRGLEPLQYLDYFRMTGWFTAPGNDAPARGSSFRQTKVSSSIAHLYGRPRTWLEAFYGMGWNSNGEWLTSQLDHHIIAGGNLLCLHGLYYSTHGGWWEWAPPCFHFRMPYWPHMKKWLEYAERMSFVLSQGRHVCDIAILYPTESMQAYPEATPDSMWKVADLLSDCGLDYDFIDYHSLQKAEVTRGALAVAGEQYRVLILPDAKAFHQETWEKIEKFGRKGGLVIAVGGLPVATSRKGEGDSQFIRALGRLFRRSEAGIHARSCTEVPLLITQRLVPDFKTGTGKGRVLHRRVGERDVYMVMGVSEGTEIFFRATGKVECWDAKHGSISDQPVLRQTEKGTWIRSEAASNASKLYVFSPGEPVYGPDEEQDDSEKDLRVLPLTGSWEVEIIPTMNNKWGDFRLPASAELIGPEAREFQCAFIPDGNRPGSLLAVFPDSAESLHYGYADFMETATIDAAVDLDSCLERIEGDSSVEWEPYAFSWQYGVRDNPGSQGYHGLKGKVDNRFLILDRGGHQLFRTFVYAPRAGTYRIEQEGTRPAYIYIDGKTVGESLVALSEGWHRLLLAYPDTKRGSYVLAEKQSNSTDGRDRSAVLLYPAESPVPRAVSPYDSVVAMKWYASEHLPFSPNGGQKGRWAYRFLTAPGTASMRFDVRGSIEDAYVNGRPLAEAGKITEGADGEYCLELNEVRGGIDTVALVALPERGFDGASFFANPVKLQCRTGRMPVGDWSQWGALKYFSGGMRYTKQVELSPAEGETVSLDLGLVDATCEVWINGKEVDCLLSPPYRLDITRFVKAGLNEIEVLVYSSLSNHYQSVPSAYRGEPRAGLIGPVQLELAR